MCHTAMEMILCLTIYLASTTVKFPAPLSGVERLCQAK